MGPSVNINDSPLGYEISFANYLVLFGNKKATFENIKSHYPQYEFTRVKQTHSDIIVESPNTLFDYSIQADAHYSRTAQLGLCISTADCVPAFIIHPMSGLICGIHAGWRGVANRIIPKSIARMHALGAPNQELYVLVGPHIQQPNFEVEDPVRDQILKSIGCESADIENFSHKTTENKSKVDLNKVVKEQLYQEGINEEHIYTLHIDTFANTDFHSHRRDRENAGRQLSFILRI